jgi:hypothetical protein
MATSNFKMLRPLYGKTVRQRTSDSFISANDLLMAGNEVRCRDGLNPKTNILEYFRKDSTEELVEAIKAKEGITRVKTSGRGRTAGTWVHPVVAMDLALWLSPSLKYEVYRWMMDQLLIRRLGSADSFKAMNEALDSRYKIGAKYWYYTNTANAIRDAVGVENWDAATETQLMVRDKIQDAIVIMCEQTSSIPFDSLVTNAIDSTLKRMKAKVA